MPETFRFRNYTKLPRLSLCFETYITSKRVVFFSFPILAKLPSWFLLPFSIWNKKDRERERERLPCRELTYLTWRKGKSSPKVPW